MEVITLEGNTLGKRMRWLRDKRDLKQHNVAKDLGITPYQLSRYESGKSKPDPELIAEIASYYNVTTDYLLGRTDEKSPSNKAGTFEEFIAHDPEMQRFFKEFPKSKEENRRKLYKMWEILKEEEDED